MEEKVIHLEQIIKWVDNRPVATYTEIIDKEAVADLPLAVMGMKYEREPLEIELGIDAEFEGMTIAEVTMIRLGRRASRGDDWAIQQMLDRILGKPKATSEIKVEKVDYTDYLNTLKKTIEAEYSEEDL